MAKRVIIIRHGDDPPDDRVYTYLVGAGFEPVVKKPFAGETIGELDGSVAGTVIHGGGYNAFDTAMHPFLRDEDRWIAACLRADIPTLGICQGAQQIAHHLGGHVGPLEGDPHEFGYYEIRPEENAKDFLTAPMVVTQAHFFSFDIPRDAQKLASSASFPNQAFRLGHKVYGLLFHAEVTIEGFRRWQRVPWAMYGKPGAQTREEQNRLMHLHDAAQADWFYGFLGRLFGKAA